MLRFSNRAPDIAAALTAVDREIERETDPPARVVARGPQPQVYTSRSPNIPHYDYRDFALEAHLGTGGIGKVYRAWWRSEKRHVAVKMLRKSWWRQPDADELFFREAAILVDLRHPHIVEVHGVGRTPQGGCFLVMELIDGADLSSLVGKDASLDKVCGWAAQAADALAFAHQRGIIHRDIKPSNLLLDRFGNLRVADFGLAIAPSIEMEFDGGPVGTIAYMAPEQLFGGTHRSGLASDVFSLGAVLYTLLTGKTPYDGKSLSDLMKRRINRPHVPALRTLRADLPANVETVVSRCLEINPNERFASAEELAVALRQIVDTNAAAFY